VREPPELAWAKEIVTGRRSARCAPFETVRRFGVRAELVDEMHRLPRRFSALEGDGTSGIISGKLASSNTSDGYCECLAPIFQMVLKDQPA
jgi:hypothetical protein